MRAAAPLRTPLLAALLALLLLPTVTARTAGPGFNTLHVDGDMVQIHRDDFGRPHIFAATNRGLFLAYGYVVAEDRLWQLDLNRRAARGRLAEILGPAFVNTDRLARTVGYTDAELDAQFARLPAEIRDIFEAYGDGINRYLAEVIAPDPLSKLPFEFHALGCVFEPWTMRDSVAFGAFMLRRFGEIGGSRELANLDLLNALVATFGTTDGYGVFNDLRWLNDPDSPVTVPPDAVGKRQKRTPAGHAPSTQLRAVHFAPGSLLDEDEAKRQWESLGVPTRLGSYAWVVSAARSAEGVPLLYGGPQMGFSAPEVVHEVQLKGGGGFNVTGMAFAGVPPVLIGRNDHVAWTSTTATGDNVDVYLETLCDAGRGPTSGYIYAGACRPFEARVETILVRGGAPVSATILRSSHGPIVGSSGPVAVAQKRAHWQREIETAGAFLGFDRARNINDFEKAVRQIITSHNFLYADRVGNIAYWQAGQVPIRPAGVDPRLPLPGDGSAEWPGGILPIPTSINPAQGYLANWNNKPSVDYDNADNQIFGKQYRLWDIDDRLATGPISLDDMRDIPKDIARVKAIGREARFLKPYLLAALGAVPPVHPLAAQCRAILTGWDGSAFADAVNSTTLFSGEVIFTVWLNQMIQNTFGDELGARAGEASSNMLLHVLDQALGGGSGVPPTRDYLNGVPPDTVMSATFDQVVAALAATQGSDPAGWTAPRGVTNFVHAVVGLVGSIPTSNRATYAQIVALDKSQFRVENIFTLGQSGFIKLAPAAPGGFELDPHFRDQLDRYRAFEYKPMPLYRNTQLKE